MKLAVIGSTIALAATHAVAGPAAAGEGSVYFADSPNPGSDEPTGAILCPALAKIAGSTLTFDVGATTSRAPIKYGKVNVKLDGKGGAHANVALPAHKPFVAEGVDKAYATLAAITVDVTPIAIAGDGKALKLRLTAPGTSRDELEHCDRTMIHTKAVKPANHSPFDGGYGARTGGSNGSLVHCPGTISIEGGKASFAVFAGLQSYVVSEAPVGSDGAFASSVTLTSLPDAETLANDGYTPQQVGQLTAAHALKLEVTGKLKHATAAATSKKGRVIELEIRSEPLGETCNAEMLEEGFDIGTAYIDCAKLSPSEREQHSICSM